MGNGAGWASALGAAILGGQQGFQHQQQLERQLKQQQFENELRRQEAADRHAQALQAAILGQDRVNELPKQHARDDFNAAVNLYGADAFNDPSVLANAKTAGNPIPTIDIMDRRKNELIQHGFDQPALTQDQLASRYGVAPKTGAQIPLGLKVGSDKLRREDATDQMMLQNMQSFSQGGNGGYEVDPKSNLPANTPANRAKEIFDPMKRLTAMYGPAIDAPANVMDRDRAAAAAKAEVPPAMIQRVTGGMNETIDNLSTAQRELEKMFPGIDAQDDPKKQAWEQPYNGPLDLAKAKMLRTAYNFMDTPYNKAIQAASLGNVQGWGNLVPGRINPGIQKKAEEHQSAFGNETPRATYMRNKELIGLLGRNRQDLLTPQMREPQQPQQVQAPPTAPVINPNMVAGQEPPAAPRAAQPPAAAPPAQPAQPITSVKFSDIVARAKPGEDPVQLAQRLKARGITVLMDAQPQSKSPALGGFSKATGISAAPPSEWPSPVEAALRALGIH